MGNIRNMPLDEQPYEKCKKYGVEALTDSELLAVFIRTGTKNENPIEIARHILNSAGDKGLVGLMNLTMNELKNISGIGEVKSIQLLCLTELSKRISRQKAYDYVKLDNPESIADYYMEKLRHINHEEVWVCLFDSKCKLIADRMLSSGTINAALISQREILRYALVNDAVSFVMVHNHPSGDPAPSREDIALTAKVLEAGRTLNIKLLDHIIIGDCVYTSMKEIGIINE